MIVAKRVSRDPNGHRHGPSERRYARRRNEERQCGNRSESPSSELEDSLPRSIGFCDLAILWASDSPSLTTCRIILQTSKADPNPINADFVSGCALMIGRKTFHDFGGFDSEIFMYFEDVLLCCHVRKLGLHIERCLRAAVDHLAGSAVAPPTTRRVAQGTVLQVMANDDRGGESMVVLSLISELVDAGWNVHLATTKTNELQHYASEAGATVHGFDLFDRRANATLTASLVKLCEALQPSAIHTHGSRAVLASRRAVRLVRTVHTIHVHHYLYRSRPTRLAGGLLERVVSRSLKRVSYVTEADQCLGRIQDLALSTSDRSQLLSSKK